MDSCYIGKHTRDHGTSKNISTNISNIATISCQFYYLCLLQDDIYILLVVACGCAHVEVVFS